MFNNKPKKPHTLQKRKPRQSFGDFMKEVTLFCTKWGVLSAFWISILLSGYLFFLYFNIPSPQKIAAEATRNPTVRIFDSAGVSLGTSGDGYGQTIIVSQLPRYVPMAFVSTEDQRFYNHKGIDVRSLVRAIVVNFSTGKVRQGGSTISQQVAKNLFLTNERTYERKIKELVYTLWLESKFTKNQILSLYLNRVYLSNGQYGIDSAARHYFGIPATRLSIWQSAVLAGMLKAPNSFNPALHPVKSANRAKLVLNKMVENKIISRQTATQNKQDSVRTVAPKTQGTHYFTRHAVQEAKKILKGLPKDVIIYTTLKPSLQKKAEKIITKWSNYFIQDNVNQAALLGVSSTGAIETMVGGALGVSEFNRATQSRRPIGSLFKSFTYAKAMEFYSPDDTIEDSAVNINGYSPRNYTRKEYGWVTLRQAFVQSYNISAVKLFEYLGRENVVDFAKSLGMRSKMELYPSIALGSKGASLLETVASYGAFVKGGEKMTPYAITKITDLNGNVLYRHENKKQRVMGYEQVQNFNSIARDVLKYGTGKRAFIEGVDLAGKTGTTQDYRDAWFIGYSDAHIAGVWVGNDDNTPTDNITGGSYPAVIWRDYMLEVLKTNPDTLVNIPKGIQLNTQKNGNRY